jgi:hypothetical protein
VPKWLSTSHHQSDGRVSVGPITEMCSLSYPVATMRGRSGEIPGNSTEPTREVRREEGLNEEALIEDMDARSHVEASVQEPTARGRSRGTGTRALVQTR